MLETGPSRSQLCRQQPICRCRSFSNSSVAAADNELCTHFVPHVPDFSRSQSTRNGLFKPNRTPRHPHGAASEAGGREAMRIRPPPSAPQSLITTTGSANFAPACLRSSVGRAAGFDPARRGSTPLGGSGTVAEQDRRAPAKRDTAVRVRPVSCRKESRDDKAPSFAPPSARPFTASTTAAKTTAMRWPSSSSRRST